MLSQNLNPAGKSLAIIALLE